MVRIMVEAMAGVFDVLALLAGAAVLLMAATRSL